MLLIDATRAVVEDGSGGQPHNDTSMRKSDDSEGEYLERCDSLGLDETPVRDCDEPLALRSWGVASSLVVVAESALK